MTFIKTNICKELIIWRLAPNGRHYTDIITTDLKEPDDKGNTLSVYCDQTKDQREAKEPRQYIGRGKHMETGWSSRAINPDVNKVEVPEDELPF